MMICLLQVGFILLKVAGVIDWSWWWVLSPLWAFLIVATSDIVIDIVFDYGNDKTGKD